MFSIIMLISELKKLDECLISVGEFIFEYPGK